MSDTKEVFSEKLKRREIYPVIIVGPTTEYNIGRVHIAEAWWPAWNTIDQ
jgi:hypothetical protein